MCYDCWISWWADREDDKRLIRTACPASPLTAEQRAGRCGRRRWTPPATTAPHLCANPRGTSTTDSAGRCGGTASRSPLDHSRLSHRERGLRLARRVDCADAVRARGRRRRAQQRTHHQCRLGCACRRHGTSAPHPPSFRLGCRTATACRMGAQFVVREGGR